MSNTSSPKIDLTMSTDLEAAVKKLEERIAELSHTTEERFLEVERDKNAGVITISGAGVPVRTRGEPLFQRVSDLCRNVLNIYLHPSEVVSIGRLTPKIKSPIIMRYFKS